MVGKLMEKQTQWQVCHPGSVNRDACLEHLRSLLPNLS
jgi:hypothetical protein